MDLAVDTMWSPDLDPPSTGLPADAEDYKVAMQVSLSERGRAGTEVFSFTVCSPSALSAAESGRFVTQTLVLVPFRWDGLRARLERLVAQGGSCTTWDEVIDRLSPFLRHDDAG